MAQEENRAAPKRAPKYSRLTRDEHTTIAALREAGFSIARIAGRIGRSKATVSKELKRNSGKRGYSPGQARRMADERAAAKGRMTRKLTDAMWQEAKDKLKSRWSFGMTSNRARPGGRLFVCRETPCPECRRRQKPIRPGKSPESLPPLSGMRKKRAKRGPKNGAGRGRIPNRADISKRPKAAGGRVETGRREGGLVVGLNGTGGIATLAERPVRFTPTSRVAAKETGEVSAAIIEMMRGRPREMLRTLTFDNGKEFAAFARVGDAPGAGVFFARPCHSWGRGSNGNRNGVVRIVLPKGGAFDRITEEERGRIERLLNGRPLRRPG